MRLSPNNGITCFAIVAALMQLPGAAHAGSLTTLHVFGGTGDVSNPWFNKPIIKNGVLFGVTLGGGANSNGGIYRFDIKSRQEQVLYSFPAYYNKRGKLVGAQQADIIYFQGLLYGETGLGGEENKGLIFTVDPNTGAETDFVSFPHLPNTPRSRLVPIGNQFYGVAEYDQASSGAIYSVPQAGGASTLDYAFSGFGNTPDANLLAVNGVVYGTVFGGGDSGNGGIFEFDPSTNTVRVLHDFSESEGSMPAGDLIFKKDSLFGVTDGCGPSVCGGLYQFKLSTGALTILHTFPSHSQNDGNSPDSPLAYVGGKIYGATYEGGTAGCGTIFSYDPHAKSEQVLYDFTGTGDGCNPAGGLIYDKGIFYGTTTTSQPYVGPGSLFSFVP